MRRCALALVLALAFTSGTAHAEKKRVVAQALSGIGTAASALLMLGGFVFADQTSQVNKPLLYSGIASGVFTPSLGQYYAGQYLTIGFAVRVAAAGLATYALTEHVELHTCDFASSSTQQCEKLTSPGFAIVGIAAIAFIGGIAYDVGDAAPAVDRWNRRHNIYVTPALSAPNAPGVMFGGRF